MNHLLSSNSRASAMTFKLEPLKEKTVFFNNQRKPVTRSEREKGKFPYYGAAGIQDYVSEYIFDGRYILVGEDGTVISNDEYPVVQIAEGKFWVNNHAHVIRPTNDEDFDFLYYALVGSKIKNLVTGAVQPKLSMTNLKSLLIPWPENGEVRRSIGRTLSILDGKIKANKAVSATLEEIAQTIFKSWFIDFDPVRAKMSGEMPDGMDDATAALFPDSMEESELGSIPKGWELRTIESLCETFLGGTPSRARDQYWGGDIPWINSGKVNEFRITTPSEYITREGLENSSTKLLAKGTTVLAITGATLGQFSRLEINACANQSVVGIVASDYASDEFLYLNIKNGINRLIAAQTGGAQQHINKQNVNEFQIVYPGQELMNAFTSIASPLFSEISSLALQSDCLAQIRDALLPRLISGELQMPEEMLAS